MDKKSILLGVAFLAGGFIIMFQNAAREADRKQELLEQEAQRQQQMVEQQVLEDPASASPSAVSPQWVTGSNPSIPPAVTAIDSEPKSVGVDTITEVLENDAIRVTFTSRGGAIKSVLLKNYPRDNPHTTEDPRPVILNSISDTAALALKRDLGNGFIHLANDYSIERADAESIVFVAELSEGLQVRRTYWLNLSGEKHELHSIHHQTDFVNNSSTSYNLQPVFLNLGTAAPTEADFQGFNLNAAYMEDGDFDNILATKLAGGGIIFKSDPKPRITETGIIEWGAVKNQFFTSIYTPNTPGESFVARAVKFPVDPANNKEANGITAELSFSIPTLAPGSSHRLEGLFYAGPTDFDALSKLGNAQEDVMQLGWFIGMFLGIVAFVAKVLLTIMSTIHDWVGNWGVAIILTTFTIRIILYPLTAKAARAAKRMQKLSKPMAEIREKYKDNQQKANQEIMEYMKKHRINPLSGCWPVLVQFPIFIAFFNLLRNSSDLRFAEFLWINDLSMPDATIPLGSSLPFVGSALNVLPFVWLVSMYFQMKMMPSPGVDNPQMKVMKFMPFIFFPFTYFFSSGLVLYWTTTNLFSIFQQSMTNRIKDDEDIAIETELSEKKGKLSSQGPLISKKKKNKKK